MINHITLCASDIDRSRIFYQHALAPLGYRVLADEKNIGFGTEDVDGVRDFWLTQRGGTSTDPSFSCLAFTAHSKTAVDEFYAAALVHGGKNNGAPGYRPAYHAGYYAAFVFDPDGYNIEVVFDDPEKSRFCFVDNLVLTKEKNPCILSRA